ncbi:MAG: isochorismatase family protein [Rhodospirillales bacterium]|jgi:nicotinamidase-related amidase|nr:isochorismatase family protein [Rhodospirillales bacterium]
MSAPSNIQKSLVNVDDSILVLIDIQDHFLNKYDQAKSQNLVSKVSWLLNVAEHLDVPVVAMAEDIEYSGPLTQAIQDALPKGTKVHNKDYFGIAGNPEILAEVNAKGRKTAICVGTETDVCVAQSAIGLLNEGYSVVTLRDAVASMDADEEIGLGRMRDAGVAISSVKALYYEWLRSVTNTVNLGNKVPELETIMRPVNLAL